MKKALLMISFGLLTLAGYANALARLALMCHQPLKATISRLYPGVKAVKWEKEDGNYEAGTDEQWQAFVAGHRRKRQRAGNRNDHCGIGPARDRSRVRSEASHRQKN